MKRLVSKHPLRSLVASVLVAAGFLVAVATALAQSRVPTVNFQNATVTVNESAASVTVTVVLSSPTPDTVTIQYGTANGTATAPADYQATSGTLTFPPGNMSQSIVVPIVSDSVAEPDEQFQITLSNPQNATLGGQSVSTVMITESGSGTPPSPTVSFEYSSWTYNELAGTATVTVLMTGTPTAPVSVNYATADNTATAGADYTAVSGTLTWQPSEAGTTKSFTIPILPDSQVEPTEAAYLLLSGAVNATIGQGGAFLIITDSNSPGCSP